MRGVLRCERDHWEWRSGADWGIMCVWRPRAFCCRRKEVVGSSAENCTGIPFCTDCRSWEKLNEAGELCKVIQNDSSATAAPLNSLNGSSRISRREDVMWIWLHRPLFGAQLHNWLAVGFWEIISPFCNGFNHVPPQTRLPRTSEYDLTWKNGLCRCY